MTRIRVPGDLEGVTTVAAESDPRDAGIRRDAPEWIWSAVKRLYAAGIHPAISICVRRRGRVILDRAIGHARGNAPEDPPDAPKVLATPGTPFDIFSASKAVTAMVIHLLDERRVLHLDDPVCEYVPEYVRHGKHAITIRHLLTHRAGVPNVPEGLLDLARLEQPEEIAELLCEAKPLWRPGRFLSYHAITGGFVLGEVVRRATGRTIREVLGEEILRPLGFRWGNYGVAPEDVPLVAHNAFTGPPIFPPVSTLLRRALGVDFHRAIELTNDRRYLEAIVPAGNVVTTANELSRFYQLLLDGGALAGVRIFEPRTIRRATAEQSYLEMDFTLMFPLRYGMGFMLGAEWLSLFGPGTAHAFGHVGFTNVIGWADPERDVAAAIMTSGKPVLYPEILIYWDILRRIGLACPKDHPGPLWAHDFPTSSARAAAAGSSG